MSRGDSPPRHARGAAPRIALALAAAYCALAAGCGPETALQLRLVPDPVLNTEAQILAAAKTLRLVLDAPQGFTGVTSSGHAGSLTAMNVDADSVLELVFDRPLQGLDELPRLDLHPGSNEDRSFKLTTYGMADSPPLAADSPPLAVGGQSGIRFVADESLDLLVPFNLLARHRPPRVVVTQPSDGETVPLALRWLVVEFSKAVDETSLQDGFQLIYEGAQGDLVAPLKVIAETRQRTELGTTETRSVVTVDLYGCPLNPGRYRLEVQTSIRDNAGQPLDQDASTPGADALVARMTVPGAGSPASEACAPTLRACASDSECNPGGGPVRFACVSSQGVKSCEPAATSCAALECPQDSVCAPQAGNVYTCVQDCRLIGYCDPGYRCDGLSGVCVVCSGTSCDCKSQCADICAKGTGPMCDQCIQTCEQPPSP